MLFEANPGRGTTIALAVAYENEFRFRPKSRLARCSGLFRDARVG